jgi:hypothetical protein
MLTQDYNSQLQTQHKKIKQVQSAENNKEVGDKTELRT